MAVEQQQEAERKRRELEMAQDEIAAMEREQIISDERERIARELHDDVAQILASIGLNVEWCRQQLPPESRGKSLDTRLPLVADYYGLMVNVSFQAVDPVGRSVRFYSPVFAGLTYRHARPIGNYTQAFVAHLPANWPQGSVFSCNCILNYFYSELVGTPAQVVSGPLTFGEVAYQLLNQTMVYLTVSDVGRPDHLGSAGTTGCAGGSAMDGLLGLAVGSAKIVTGPA